MKKILNLSLLAIILLLSRGWLSRAQTDSLRTVSEKIPAYFPEGSAEYIHNDEIEAFLDTINVPSVLRIEITAYASPVGSTNTNQTLSEQRAKSLRDSLAAKFPDVPITAEGYGEDWTGLAMILMNGDQYDDALSVILNTPRFIKDSKGNIIDGRKKQLMNLDGGNTWKTLRKNCFPQLRRADIYVTRSIPKALPKIKDTTIQPIGPTQDTTVIPVPAKDTIKAYIPEPVTMKDYPLKRILLAPRTNLLVPAMNIGLAIPIGKHLSIEGDFYSPWIGFDDKNSKCFQLQAADIELRYWFSPKSVESLTGNTLTGHSIDIGCMAGQYDFEKRYNGMQGEFYGAYIGYSWTCAPVKWMRLMLGMDIGYIHTRYRKYEVYTDRGKLFRKAPLATDLKANKILPVKASVSLAFPLDINAKKDILKSASPL